MTCTTLLDSGDEGLSANLVCLYTGTLMLVWSQWIGGAHQPVFATFLWHWRFQTSQQIRQQGCVTHSVDQSPHPGSWRPCADDLSLCTGTSRNPGTRWHLRVLQVWKAVAPSGIGIAVGMYVAPKFTIPRVLGSIIEQVWLQLHPNSHGRLMVVVASGLVLGEGTAASFTAVIQAFRAHPS